MKKLFTVSLVILPLALAFLSGAEAIARTYTTNFPLTENPISESGNWLGGQTAGNNLWGNCQTNGTMVYGVSEPTQYGDPTAILTGSWGPDQTVQGTVKINTTPTGTCCQEIEVRVRMTINSSAHTISGYEVYCSVNSNNPYCHIARWNGANGSWCNIEASTPSIYLVNGDVLKGTVTGTNPVIITGYRNNVQIMQATDTGQNCSPGGAAGPWTSGAPGVGFYDNQDTNWNYFGFSNFTATDGTVSDMAGPISNLSLEIIHEEKLPATKTLAEGGDLVTVTSGLNQVVKGTRVYDPALYLEFDPTTGLLTDILISWIDPNINDSMYGQRILTIACDGGNNASSIPNPGLPEATDGMVTTKPQVSLSEPPATERNSVEGVAACHVCPNGFQYNTTTSPPTLTGVCNDGSSYVTGYLTYQGTRTKNISLGYVTSASLTVTIGAGGFNYIGEDWAVDLNPTTHLSERPCVTSSDFSYCQAILKGTLKATLTPCPSGSTWATCY
jgi:hypothetical protein